MKIQEISIKIDEGLIHLKYGCREESINIDYFLDHDSLISDFTHDLESAIRSVAQLAIDNNENDIEEIY